MKVTLAVDIGGTKLAAGLVSGAGQLLVQQQVATTDPGAAPGSADPAVAGAVGAEAGDALFERLAAVISTVLEAGEAQGLEAAACGVGCGGPMTAGGLLVSPLNIPAWRDYPLAARLADRFGLATTVDNDAKALALGEGWCGAAAGVDNFLAMVISTGVGGGIVLEGRLLQGASGNAGHIGHVIVEPDGRRCACGARGCLEAEASGTALAAITGRPAAEAPLDVRRRTGRLVGRAIASVASLLDLRLACVAGSVALGFGEPFFAAAQAEVDASARLSYVVGARVVPAGLGAAGPLVGAAALVREH